MVKASKKNLIVLRDLINEWLACQDETKPKPPA
jgi:hypothetical protein